jgi:hypothetical protein
MTFSYFIATESPYESIMMAGKWHNTQGKTNSVCYESHNSADSEVLTASFSQYVMVTQVGISWRKGWHREIKSMHRWDERELMLTKRRKMLMRSSSQSLYKSGLGNLKGSIMHRSQIICRVQSIIPWPWDAKGSSTPSPSRSSHTMENFLRLFPLTLLASNSRSNHWITSHSTLLWC